MRFTRRHVTITLASIGVVFVCSFFATMCWILITFHQFLPLIPFVPKLLGFEGPQTYLILFQNNMELRPGGGFIGSYGTVTLDKGKVGPIAIHNTYDADGQLHKHVEPSSIERRFLQKNLFMRDSNFDVDFAKSAEKVAYMYTLETRNHVQGVIGVDLSYMQSIVALLSPVYLWQYNQAVTPENFFMLTESHADQQSFSGSMQKQDFLRSLADSMLAKIHASKITFVVGVVQRSLAAISQKHLLFESEDPVVQRNLSEIGLSSTLTDTRTTKPDVINDFLGINEANIGVNKANLFLKRTIEHHVTIQNSGAIEENLKLTYTNNASKNQWPAGQYIAYVRIIVPEGTTLTSISFDGKKQKIVSAITDYHMYEQPGFKPPDGLEVDHAEEEGKTLYGFIILVDYHKTLTVDVQYKLPITLAANKITYDLVLFKQPGTVNDLLTFSLSYPTSYRHLSIFPPVTDRSIPFTYVLKTAFLTDKHVVITLEK